MQPDDEQSLPRIVNQREGSGEDVTGGVGRRPAAPFRCKVRRYLSRRTAFSGLWRRGRLRTPQGPDMALSSVDEHLDVPYLPVSRRPK